MGESSTRLTQNQGWVKNVDESWNRRTKNMGEPKSWMSHFQITEKHRWVIIVDESLLNIEKGWMSHNRGWVINNITGKLWMSHKGWLSTQHAYIEKEMLWLSPIATAERKWMNNKSAEMKKTTLPKFWSEHHTQGWVCRVVVVHQMPWLWKWGWCQLVFFCGRFFRSCVNRACACWQAESHKVTRWCHKNGTTSTSSWKVA